MKKIYNIVLIIGSCLMCLLSSIFGRIIADLPDFSFISALISFLLILLGFLTGWIIVWNYRKSTIADRRPGLIGLAIIFPFVMSLIFLGASSLIIFSDFLWSIKFFSGYLFGY